MPYEHILFVEGPDDRHALWHLLDQHGVSVCFFDVEEINLISADIAIKPLGGYQELRRRLPRELRISSGLLRAGFVVDADEKPVEQWKSLSSRIREAGGQDVPENLSVEGWVGKARLPDGDIEVGAWLMPNNQAPGAIEEFAVTLMPPGDHPLWDYADTCVVGLADHMGTERFEELPKSKARVHTWLAWQKEPGKPIGQAIKKGFLDHQAPVAQAFVDWVKRLFGA